MVQQNFIHKNRWGLDSAAEPDFHIPDLDDHRNTKERGWLLAPYRKQEVEQGDPSPPLPALLRDSRADQAE